MAKKPALSISRPVSSSSRCRNGKSLALPIAMNWKNAGSPEARWIALVVSRLSWLAPSVMNAT